MWATKSSPNFLEFWFYPSFEPTRISNPLVLPSSSPWIPWSSLTSLPCTHDNSFFAHLCLQNHRPLPTLHLHLGWEHPHACLGHAWLLHPSTLPLLDNDLAPSFSSKAQYLSPILILRRVVFLALELIKNHWRNKTRTSTNFHLPALAWLRVSRNKLSVLLPELPLSYSMNFVFCWVIFNSIQIYCHTSLGKSKQNSFSCCSEFSSFV